MRPTSRSVTHADTPSPTRPPERTLVGQPLPLSQAAASQSGWLRGGPRTSDGSVPDVVVPIASAGQAVGSAEIGASRYFALRRT